MRTIYRTARRLSVDQGLTDVQEEKADRGQLIATCLARQLAQNEAAAVGNFEREGVAAGVVDGVDNEAVAGQVLGVVGMRVHRDAIDLAEADVESLDDVRLPAEHRVGAAAATPADHEGQGVGGCGTVITPDTIKEQTSPHRQTFTDGHEVSSPYPLDKPAPSRVEGLRAGTDPLPEGEGT